MAQRPVDREPGESLKNIGFVVPLSLAELVQERSKELGMSKSDLMRSALERFLDESEVAA